MKIGILREYKQPEDIRVPLSPVQCKNLMLAFTGCEIVVEPYDKRCFTNAEYAEMDIQLQSDLSDCDVLLGVKEVPKERLLPNKTYFFFSHTIKEQDYNWGLIKTLLSKNIRMIDHETLVDETGKRVLGFGRWAGVVGAHYALLMLGEKQQHYALKPAHACTSMADMLTQYQGLSFPPAKIVLTGKGRVGQGAQEVLQAAGIEEVSPKAFLQQTYNEAVYTTLDIEELYVQPNGAPVDRQSFFANPQIAENGFIPYAQKADVLINGMYWDYRAPRLFEVKDITEKQLSLQIISDITCDVEGSVPITLRQTAIADPYIGFDGKTCKEIPPFSKNSIDIMAVGNLPNELPRDASADFGLALSQKVLPELFKEQSSMLYRATICQNGKLHEPFTYLQEWVDGKKA